MGPTEALVRLAHNLGLDGLTVEASKKVPIIAMHLKPDGHAVFKILDEGETIRGFPNYTRTGVGTRPRPFRDSAKYTLIPGKYREHMARVVDAMVDRHPRSKALRAFSKALRRKHRLPKAVAEVGDKAIVAPFFNGKLVFPVVEPDLRDGNPYEEVILDKPSSGPKRIDVVTGRWCDPYSGCAIKIKGLGEQTGSTLMSVNCPTTRTHGTSDSTKHLRSPMSEDTMNGSAASLTWLRQHGLWSRVLIVPDSTEGTLTYFMWEHGEDPNGPAAVILRKTIRGEATVEEIEEVAHEHTGSEAHVCVMGIREAGHRLQYVAWHYLPVVEMLSNLSDYAKACSLEDGRVLGIQMAARACTPFDLAVDEDSYSFKKHQEYAIRWCDSPTTLALLDHIIEGHPFPFVIRQRVRSAYASQEADESITGCQFHLKIQEALLE